MKALFNGMLAVITFYIINQFIMTSIGQLVLWGDEFFMSYHMFTYTGLLLLCGLIVICTTMIIEKIDELKDVINKDK